MHVKVGKFYVTISLGRKFDFNSYQQVTSLSYKGKHVIVDMSRCETIYPAALGILIMLGETSTKTITIIGAKGDVLETLRMARFDQRFDIQ